MSTESNALFTSAAEQAFQVAAGEVSPVELVERALARIEAVQPTLNCFAHVWADEARAEARAAADAVAAGGPLGVLHGVPVAVKETTQVAGRRFTAGSLTQEHTVATFDAAIVRALRRAGAIIVGATTSPEFAHTLVTDSPLWGPTRNVWNTDLAPGGSSGGSATAVAAGCVALAEGSDMGGSVRIPAAWSGVVGLKPGLGRIPMDVLPGLFDSISHHGPLARSVDDARLFLAATQGPDEADIQSVTTPLDLSKPLVGDVRGMRIAVSLDLGDYAVHPEIRAAVQHAADALAAAGAIVEPVDVHFNAADEWVWIQLWGVFMSAYFGHLVEEHRDRMDKDVVGLISYGNSLSATDYKRLEIARTDVWRRLSTVLADHEVLLCPTMALPPVYAEKSRDQRLEQSNDGKFHTHDMTGVFNLVGQCPAMSVPCGSHVAEPYAGVPIGLQIVGRRWREDTVLEVGRAVELVVGQVPQANVCL
jgi:Asp-tRNA(Asn)/Glu-tRNA(Gln) amidotransferase A subunit family amidase